MPRPAPTFCRREAIALFTASVARLQTPRGLLGAAVAISMHELPDADFRAVDAALQRIAEAVRGRVQSGSAAALLAHAHAHLFDEMGFRGDDQAFGDPGSSYLPLVLKRRRGLPIALSLVYKSVLERVGLRVEGINAPGHFLTAVRADGAAMLVDAFAGGRVLTRVEARERAVAAAGRAGLEMDELLPVATHREWIRRWLRNLYALFEHRGQQEQVAAMVELNRLL